jgi:plasmid stabilization system protein ParE
LKPLQISPGAANDLLDIAEYLEGESGNPFLGDRFLSAASSTFNVLANFTLAGRQRPTIQKQLTPLRSLAVDSPFDKFLVFYQPLESTTLILRVLHGARDLGPLVDLDSERDA